MEDKAEKSRKCGAITKAGTPCPNWALKDKIICRFHDPQVAALTSRLGVATSAKNRKKVQEINNDVDDIILNTPEEIRDFISKTMTELRRNQLDSRRADMLIRMAKIQLDAIKAVQEAARLAAEADRVKHAGTQQGPGDVKKVEEPAALYKPHDVPADDYEKITASMVPAPVLHDYRKKE